MKKQLLVGLLSSALLITATPSYAIGWQDLVRGAAQYYSVSNISPQQEVTLGQQINKQLVASSEVKLNSDPNLNALVQRVGQRVAQASDRPNLPYTFQVAQDKSIRKTQHPADETSGSSANRKCPFRRGPKYAGKHWGGACLTEL
jgi:predicted Zn-dependent protease